ncbi:monocarboxylate transporter 10 [Trichonephila clavipes]|nr:monocarboxylate transporter 10 [Trichonephila clavipes]
MRPGDDDNPVGLNTDTMGKSGAKSSPPAKNQLLGDETDNALKLESTRNRAFEPPDGGWGWIVCLASFWTNGTIFGIMNCFGVLYVKLKDKFGETHEEAAFVTCENASQAAEIVNGVYVADNVTANYVQFWFRRFRSGIFDVKVDPRPSSKMSIKSQK